MNTWKNFAVCLCAGALLVIASTPAFAAPPVRIGVVPGGGSGEEQAVVDGVTSDLQSNGNVVVSTVNPDWYVVCNITEQPDQVGGTVKVNGNLVIKTTDGQIINTVSVQTNKSDFSLQPGAPLNKALVQTAVQEVIHGLIERARNPLNDAVTVEMDTRDKVISAQSLGDRDQYNDAIAVLSQIGPDTPHFKAVRELMAQYQMEQRALEAVQQAEALAKRKQYSPAIHALSDVEQKSKRYKHAKELIASYRAALANASRLAKLKPVASQPKPSSQTQINALEAQKKALDAQRKAIDAQEAALKSGAKP